MSESPFAFGFPLAAGGNAHRADARETVCCAVLTVSDLRTPDTVTSGNLIQETLALASDKVADHRIVPDEPDEIWATLKEWIVRDDIQHILSNGGTEFASRDTTYDAIARMLDKRIDGFDEQLRMRSRQEVGARAMHSRAVAGLAGGTRVVAMAGAVNSGE